MPTPPAVYIAPTPDPVTPVAVFSPRANAAGTSQRLTTSVLAAEGATGNGDLEVIVTFSNDGGAAVPLANDVALLSATHTTAALIAAAIRAFLTEYWAATYGYTVAGTGANIILERQGIHANDPNLNLTITPSLGVSQGSVATLAGALPSPSAIW